MLFFRCSLSNFRGAPFLNTRTFLTRPSKHSKVAECWGFFSTALHSHNSKPFPSFSCYLSPLITFQLLYVYCSLHRCEGGAVSIGTKDLVLIKDLSKVARLSSWVSSLNARFGKGLEHRQSFPSESLWFYQFINNKLPTKTWLWKCKCSFFFSTRGSSKPERNCTS